MTPDLLLEPSCGGCGETSDLYGSQMTLCESCGKTMAENKAKCHVCGQVLTRLIKEYMIRASTASDACYFVGRFATGLPEFSKKKSAANKWTLRKDLSDIRRPTKEKLKSRPWKLEDETGQLQYTGKLENSSLSSYYLLKPQGKELSAIPVAQYQQLTLAEAEEKMNNRKRSQDGYAIWMMKSGTNRPAPLGEKEPDEGEEDEDEETARKKGLGLNKKDGDDEDDTGGNVDDYSSNMGEDWEHQEIFTDDDEAVAVNPLDGEEFEPEVPAPPEIRQDDGGLSKHGKELKKLLVKSGELDDSYGEEYVDDDMDDDFPMPQPLAPKQKDAPKQEPVDNIPVQPGASGVHTAPVTEEELRAVLMLMSPMTASDLIRNFPGRLETEEEKNAFKVVMKKMCKMVNSNGRRYVVLKENEEADPNEELDDIVS